MAQLEVLEQGVERAAVQRAPRTVQVVTRLRLLPRVVVVQELVYYLLTLRFALVPVRFRFVSCNGDCVGYILGVKHTKVSAITNKKQSMSTVTY